MVKLGGMIWARALTTNPIIWVSPREWLSIFRRSRGIWLDGLLEGAFQRLSVVVAGSLAGFHGAGLFFFAQRLAGVPQQLMGPIVSRLSAPWFSSMQGARRRILLKRLLILSSIPLVLAAVCAYELASWFLARFFGEQWRDSITVLQTMAGAIVFISLAEIVKSFLIVNHNARGILFGRLAQYSGFALVIAIYRFTDRTTTPTTLGLALSVATALAFLALLRKSL
jgi:O-antigen/teichoic acid export membrane protein